MKFKDLHPNIRVRVYITFIQRLIGTTVFPFMSVYFANHLGAKWAGLLMMTVLASEILAGFYGGYLADVLGRKRVLVVAELVRFAALVGLTMVNLPGISLPFVAYGFLLVNNICNGISRPVNESMIIDVSTRETRKYVYGLTYWVNNLSVAFGMLIGAFLYEHHFLLLVGGTAVGSLISWTIIWRVLTETKPELAEQTAGSANAFSLVAIFRGYRQVFRDSLFMRYFLIGLLTVGIETQLGSYISVRLSTGFGVQELLSWGKFHVTLTGVNVFGLLLTINTVSVVLLGTWVSKWTRGLGTVQVFAFGVAVFTGGFVLLAVSQNAWLLIAGALIFTIGELIFVPGKQAMLADLAREDQRSQYVAVNSLHIRGASLVGSLGLTIGAFLPSWGMALLYVLMGLISVGLYTSVAHRVGSRQVSTQVQTPM